MYLLVTALEGAMGDQPLVVPKLEHQGTPKTLHMHAQTVSLLCKPGLWRLWETLLATFNLYFYWKLQRLCWTKGTSLECTELIYVKTMETASVSDELE